MTQTRGCGSDIRITHNIWSTTTKIWTFSFKWLLYIVWNALVDGGGGGRIRSNQVSEQSYGESYNHIRMGLSQRKIEKKKRSHLACRGKEGKVLEVRKWPQFWEHPRKGAPLPSDAVLLSFSTKLFVVSKQVWEKVPCWLVKHETGNCKHDIWKHPKVEVWSVL